MRILSDWLNHVFDILKPRYKVTASEEHPETIEKREIVLIGDDNTYDFLAMNCPCGCNNHIRLSLIPEDSPKWFVLIDNKKRITVSPSIWRTKGCKSHFFVRNSKIVWAEYKTLFERIFK